MADTDLKISEETKKLIEDRIRDYEARIQRETTQFFLCKHDLLADRCGECRGMTALGVSADIMAEILRRRGHLVAELSVQVSGRRTTSVRHQRPMKTLLGAGIGVSFFLAFAGWQGGKLILRLINRGAPTGR